MNLSEAKKVLRRNGYKLTYNKLTERTEDVDGPIEMYVGDDVYETTDIDEIREKIEGELRDAEEAGDDSAAEYAREKLEAIDDGDYGYCRVFSDTRCYKRCDEEGNRIPW